MSAPLADERLQKLLAKVPGCPACNMPCMAAPIADAEGRFYPPADGSEANLWCPACGQGWRGSDEDVKHAARYLKAFSDRDRQSDREAEARAKEQAAREKFERAQRGEW